MARKQAADPETPAGPPTDDDLVRLLGPAHAALQALLSGAPGRSSEWRQYTKRSPWVLRVSQGKKPVVYLQPERGAVRATVLLGARAVEAALAGRVARRLHPAIRKAKIYPEGRPVQVRVTGVSGVAGVEQLLAVKLKPDAPAGPPRARPAAKVAR